VISLPSPASYLFIGLWHRGGWEGTPKDDNGFQVTAGTFNPSTPGVDGASGGRVGERWHYFTRSRHVKTNYALGRGPLAKRQFRE
jgi:hypothetical protein